MAGRIPQQFIDELISRADIVELIDARVPLRKAGRDYMACCPFHDEKTPSFTVSQQKQFYHCFGCGAHGTALGFLMEYEHLEFIEAVHELAGQVGLQVPQDTASQSLAPVNKDLYTLMEQVAGFYTRQLREHPGATRAIEYLKGRGLSGEIAARYGIGFAPPGWDNLLRALAADQAGLQAELVKVGMLVKKDEGGYYDRFRDRIMFPIRDARGRVIGFGGRVLGEDIPKYLNSPETPLFHKGRELYGLFEAREAQRNLDRLLVVEGYMDVVALAQHDIAYAVGTLGTATTPEHLEKIFRVVPQVVFCFDGDRAGREAAWRALENCLSVMREGRQANFLFLPDGEDPDTLVRKEGGKLFEARLAQATPFSNFLYENLLKKTDSSSLDGRARLVELARPLLSKLPAGVFQQMMVTRLAELAQMEPRQLNQALQQGGAKAKAGSLPKTAKRAARQKLGVRMSPVRIAISLLLQRPELAVQAGDPKRFASFQIPGLELLVSLIEIVQAHPQLSSGALLERWRGTDEEPSLMKLVQWQPVLREDGWEAEFRGALDHLYAQGSVEQRQEYFISRSGSGELTAEEKLEWQKLLALKVPPK